MGSDFSWIKTGLERAKPSDSFIRENRGVDLDQNGHLEDAEFLSDANRDSYVGDSKDWEAFFNQHKEPLFSINPLFRSTDGISSSNPIHDLITIESEILLTKKDVQQTYDFLRAILKKVKTRLEETPHLFPQERLELVYRVAQEEGVQFINDLNFSNLPDPASFITNIQNRSLPPDDMSFIVLMVAHEMGWPVFGIKVPLHFFVRWEDRNTRFNMDFGEMYSDDYYRQKHSISEEAEKIKGIYLKPLSRKELLSLFFHKRGFTKREFGQHEEAIKDFDEAVRLNPKNISSYVSLGALHWYSGRYNEAIRNFDTAIQWDSQYFPAHAWRGASRSRLGRFTEAIRDFDEAIRLNPKLINAYLERGYVKMELGLYNEAIKDIDKAIQHNPNDPNFAFAYAKRGWAKCEMKQYAGCIQDCEKSLQLNPKDSVTARILRAAKIRQIWHKTLRFLGF